MIYLLTSCNTEERIAQNIYIHNSNRNKKNKKNKKKINYVTRTILIKKRIGIGYKNYEKHESWALLFIVLITYAYPFLD